ncbi:long-chain-fatty-acid--CoA ligase [Phyllobacterium myrsinacearum]
MPKPTVKAAPAKPAAAPKTAASAAPKTAKPVGAKKAAASVTSEIPEPAAKAKTAAPVKPAAKTKAAAPAARTEPAKAVSLAKMPEAKLWVKSYPEGVPAEIGPLPHENINELFAAAYKKYANRPSFTCMGKAMTYAEMDRHSRDLGAWLQSRGLVKGDRVAVMMPNILQYPVAIAAILRAGLTVVNINPLYTPRELEHQLKDSGAKAIIILENFATTLQKVLTATPIKHVVVATMGDMLGLKGHIVNLVVRRVKKMVPAWSLPGHTPFKTALSQGAALTLKPVEVKRDDVAFLQYTGGTTGVSKGAILTHSNIVANVTQMRLWVEVGFRKKGRPDNLTFICALPLYHIFGLTVNAMISMELGGNNVLIPNPRDIPAFVKELQKVPIHVFPGLNTLFNGLLNNEDFRKLDFRNLILSLGGGMAVQRPVADRWFDVTGGLITEGFGLSETSPVASANRLDATEFSGTIGTPLPSTDFSIRDDDGKELPLMEVGEICIRGPQVMAGYWNRPDETAKVMTSDGFFRSGDMGYMDERGYTKIVDRKKDMILVSGFNVYPNEIEEVAMEHPGVREAAAIGVPNEHSGEVVKLFIVRKDPLLTEEAVKAFCAERLTNYKRPRTVEFRDELPKSNVGKILRRELRG